MNPIELVFGMWKNRCADILNKETDKDVVRDKMAEVLRNIEVFEVKRCIEHVCSTVWMKIRNRQDILTSNSSNSVCPVFSNVC